MDLEICKNWEEKLDVFLLHVPDDKTSLSVKDKKALCTTIYKHILAIRNYDLSSFERIRTPITLLRPTLQIVNIVEEDYGLHKVLLLPCTDYNHSRFNFSISNNNINHFRLRETRWKYITLKVTILQC